MPASLYLLLDLFQLGLHPFRVGLPPYPEPPVLRPRTDVREAQKRERLRLAQAPTCPALSRVPAELNQPGLVRVQLQTVLRQPLAKLDQEPLGFVPAFKPDNEVVGPTHDHHITAAELPPPPVGPPVQYVVQA